MSGNDELKRFTEGVQPDELHPFWSHVEGVPSGDNFDMSEAMDLGLREALEAYGGEPQLPRWLTLRVTGPYPDGCLPQDAVSDLLPAFQKELLGGAPPNVGVEDLALDLVGFGSGSAILQLAPRSSEIGESTVEAEGEIQQTLSDAPDPFDAAIKSVTELHETAETQGDLREFSDSPELVRGFAQLSDVLEKYSLDLDMTWRSRSGLRRRSMLTRQGRIHAQQYFERSEQQDEFDVSGRVVELSINGTFAIKAGPSRKSPRYEVQAGGEEELLALQLTLGQPINARLRRRALVDKLGSMAQQKYELVLVYDHPRIF